MNYSNLLLSLIVAFRTYAKYLPNFGRRESLEETINRNMTMHLDKFGSLSKGLSKDIIKAYDLVHDLKVMPSMRGLQFAGDAILKNNARQYNCSFINIDDIESFGEILFLLLSGVGVGFSVQNKHIAKLPKVIRPREEGRFIVHDSIQGWAQTVNILVQAYFYGRIRPQFDFTAIRPKGSYLVTTGAKAPGAEPLKHMLETVEKMLKDAEGRKLRPIEVHDIICIISDCVLAGGIRRAALISLFDRDDKEMLESKSGNWWEKYPWRARANNSAILPRKEITEEEFREIFKKTKDSGSGEPGFSWSNNTDMGFNPCHEISLNTHQFCNLVTVNQTGIKTKSEFLKRVHSATLLATLQAAYTDFPFLRNSWKETTEKEALLGVSFTGIADNSKIVTKEWLEDGAKLVLDLNEKYSKMLGINIAARTTAIKPEGTSSTVLGSSSGIHARHSKYYLRRVRMNKDDNLALYLSQVIPDLVEDDLFSPTGVVVTIPQESPEGAILRENETALSLFKRAILYNKYWVAPGHRSGDNMHNVSCTVSVKSDEWDDLVDQMWKYRNSYSGISLLPYDGGNYKQAPFEETTKEIYEELSNLVTNIDLKHVKEETDNTDRLKSIACGGGACELDV